MRNIWHDIDPRAITPTHFTAVIEISAGSKKKYELDKKTGLLRLDRILYTSTHYPANYGFIPRTYADDGDPLDVLVFCSETLDPMVEVDCYPIGTMRMIDGDAIDDKIIAVPFQAQQFFVLHLSDDLIETNALIRCKICLCSIKTAWQLVHGDLLFCEQFF